MRIIGASVLTAAAVLGVLAQAQSQTPTEPQLEPNASADAPADQPRSSGWTLERMRKATQITNPSIAKPSAPSATPRRAAPKGPSEKMNPLNVGEAARASGNPNAVPLRWAGKFFFKKPTGDFVCSAQFISPRVLLTAAHCVQSEETGEYYTDFQFGLQYDKGKYSQAYGWRCVGSKRGWVTGGNDRWKWDYAMLLVDRDSKTGHFGWHINWRGEYDRAAKVGYPSELEKGQVVQVERGPLFFAEDPEDVVGLRHNNPKNTGGSSGGAWVANYGPSTGAGSNFIISVTSFSYNNDNNVAYGPYLDQNFKDLFNYVSRGCK